MSRARDAASRHVVEAFYYAAVGRDIPLRIKDKDVSTLVTRLERITNKLSLAELADLEACFDKCDRKGAAK